mgnify:CR=1 FL=1
MPPRRWDIRIRDILSAISKIEDYTKNFDYAGFKADTKTVDAVIRNLEIIGEAAKHIPKDIADMHQDIPWREMSDMRNLLSHEYFGVNEKLVWYTIKKDLPPLVSLLETLLP